MIGYPFGYGIDFPWRMPQFRVETRIVPRKKKPARKVMAKRKVQRFC